LPSRSGDNGAQAAFQRGPDVALFGWCGFPGPDLLVALTVSMIALLRFAGLPCRLAILLARAAAGCVFACALMVSLAPGRLPSARRGTASDNSSNRQRAGHRSRFYQTHVDDVTQPVHGTAARADQRMACLVVVEIFSAQVRIGIRPSAPVSLSLTNSPARVTPEMRP